MATLSNQVSLSFDKLTEQSLKPLVKKFEKWQCPVVSVDAPNKAKRESGSLIKDFTMTFEDGQKMLVRVKSDGTVFQVKLNTRVLPIKNVDDINKAVIEMVDYVQDNSKAYGRSKIQREKKKLAPQPPPITTSRREKIDKAKAELQQITAANSDLEAQRVVLEKDTQDKKAELETAMSSLKSEKERTIILETRMAELQRAQGA